MKDTVKKMNEHSTIYEKTFLEHIYYKGLASRIKNYKPQINRKNNPINIQLEDWRRVSESLKTFKEGQRKTSG